MRTRDNIIDNFVSATLHSHIVSSHDRMSPLIFSVFHVVLSRLEVMVDRHYILEEITFQLIIEQYKMLLCILPISSIFSISSINCAGSLPFRTAALTIWRCFLFFFSSFFRASFPGRECFVDQITFQRIYFRFLHLLA